MLEQVFGPYVGGIFHVAVEARWLAGLGVGMCWFLLKVNNLEWEFASNEGCRKSSTCNQHERESACQFL